MTANIKNTEHSSCISFTRKTRAGLNWTVLSPREAMGLNYRRRNVVCDFCADYFSLLKAVTVPDSTYLVKLVNGQRDWHFKRCYYIYAFSRSFPTFISGPYFFCQPYGTIVRCLTYFLLEALFGYFPACGNSWLSHILLLVLSSHAGLLHMKYIL